MIDPTPRVPTNYEKLDHYSDTGPLYFYGGWASNFVGGPFKIEVPIEHRMVWHPKGWVIAPTVEHFVQAMKATTRTDFEMILAMPTPSGAKNEGRKIRMRSDYDVIKYAVYLEALAIKFRKPPFKDHLLSTGSRFIAEDSPTDDIWGIRDSKGGMGGWNLLGRALMRTRESIRREL